MPTALYKKCSELITELQLGMADDITEVEPLTGGVSSDIARVKLGLKCFCVKFALPTLKVAADWHAPVHRNHAEYEWLQLASHIAPQSAVKLHGRSERLHGFAMEYIDGQGVYLWKTALLSQQTIGDEAHCVGELIGQIHAASTKPGFNPAPFQNQDDFYSLRIEPYLVYTAGQHPSVAKPLTELANELYQSNRVLVHGDISPKNILFRQSTPIILDAECATMGDASFDLAFCINHLVLKAIHLPDSRAQLLISAMQLWQAYQSYIHWEPPKQLEQRVCLLLPALMLARVDGKSPVEYLNAANRAQVSAIAIALIKKPCHSLSDFTAAVRLKLAATE